MTRRELVTSALGFLLGALSARLLPTASADHPPQYERAPKPDLADEFVSDVDCLTREQVERAIETAIDRACPVEPVVMDHLPDAIRDTMRSRRTRTGKAMSFPYTP